MDKLKIILFLFAGVLLFSQCRKDEEEWTYCQDCELSTWIGDFEGYGDYYSDDDSTITIIDVLTKVSIENSNETNLKITVSATDKFSTNFFVNKTNNDYYIDIPGSGKSLSLILSKKGNDHKLGGTAKLYHHINDTILYLDHSISFDVIKIQD